MTIMIHRQQNVNHDYVQDEKNGRCKQAERMTSGIRILLEIEKRDYSVP